MSRLSRSVSDAVEAARGITAAMFAPCSNVAPVARQIAQLTELCRASSRSKGDPIHCAIAAWHGSWEWPDTSFSRRVGIGRRNAAVAEIPMATSEWPQRSSTLTIPGRAVGFPSAYKPNKRITAFVQGHFRDDRPPAPLLSSMIV